MPEAVFNPTKLIATIPRAGRANPDWCILKACAEFRQYTTSMHDKKITSITKANLARAQTLLQERKASSPRATHDRAL